MPPPTQLGPLPSHATATALDKVITLLMAKSNECVSVLTGLKSVLTTSLSLKFSQLPGHTPSSPLTVSHSPLKPRMEKWTHRPSWH